MCESSESHDVDQLLDISGVDTLAREDVLVEWRGEIMMGLCQM